MNGHHKTHLHQREMVCILYVPLDLKSREHEDKTLLELEAIKMSGVCPNTIGRTDIIYSVTLPPSAGKLTGTSRASSGSNNPFFTFMFI
jgi:hypothetical protein